MALSLPVGRKLLSRIKENIIVCEEIPRLLIVDDDRELCDILVEFLGRSYNCVALDSAESALATLATERFDLIMTDIAMPGMNGLEMVRQITSEAPDAVIIMVSGQRTIEFAVQAMRAGAFDYITKPFELSEVIAVVRRGLDHRKRIGDLSGTKPDQRTKELLAAIDKQEFVLHYQPQVQVETGRFSGAEALLRWNHSRLGLLPPRDFVPLAEKTGAIIPLGDLILRSACAQARQWYDRGLRDFRVAVNVSPQQLRQATFPNVVERTIQEAGLPATYLEAEVTETSFIHDAEPAIQILTKLREMGIRIAIDDFGTGYSSLSYLKRLPIDSVKLDASFVKNATTDPDDAALVMAIITLAHNLKLKVIAEGIETEEQLALLRLLRCDEGQGYLFGAPVTPEVLTAQFTNGHHTEDYRGEPLESNAACVALPR